MKKNRDLMLQFTEIHSNALISALSSVLVTAKKPLAIPFKKKKKKIADTNFVFVKSSLLCPWLLRKS